jgi:hypothetical protein
MVTIAACISWRESSTTPMRNLPTDGDGRRDSHTDG